MRFGRRRREREPEDPDLRGLALAVTAEQIGATPESAPGGVWGGAMDMTFPEGTATVVAFADGAASLYWPGGGIIGAGEHEAVARAAVEWLEVLATQLDELDAPAGDELPPPGTIHLRARTFAGDRVAVADEEDLGEGRHPLSPSFYAAHELIARIREVAED